MSGACQASVRWMVGAGVGVALAALTTAGCGNNGEVSLGFPPDTPTITGEVTGIVRAPNGVFAKADRWWWWPDQLRLRQALAIINPTVSPVGEGSLVALSQVDPLDAKDGMIDRPLLVAQMTTDADGRYTIIDRGANDVSGCRLIVSVGGTLDLTRSFVTSHKTNPDESLDAVSEAVVRVVLNRLTKAPPVQLCDFTASGLDKIYEAASAAAYPATGNSVFDINQDAYAKVSSNRAVKKAIDDATGVPVQNP